MSDLEALPDYSNFVGALWSVWQLSLGAFEADVLFEGDNSFQKGFRVMLYVLSALILMIHLLNMLIAIMGQAFTDNSEIYHKMKIKEKLRFVLDKWVFKDKFLGNDKELTHILAAFVKTESDETYNNQIHELKTHFEQNLSKLSYKLFKEIKEMKFDSEEKSREMQIL
jgi:hypothetical protein